MHAQEHKHKKTYVSFSSDIESSENADENIKKYHLLVLFILGML